MFSTLLRSLTALLLAAGLALPAMAQGPELPPLLAERPSMQLMHDSKHNKRATISREEAVRRARSEYPGKVLSVKLKGGGDYYAVKIIKKGRVRVVNVPARR